MTDEHKVIVAEITQETVETIDPLVEAASAEVEAFIEGRITLWQTIRDSHVIVVGGKEGVDLNNERKREAIRRVVRKLLGLSLISEELSGVLELFELEVGQNFG